jgi:hypothetical protein
MGHIENDGVIIERNMEREKARNVREDIKDQMNLIYILNGEYSILNA